MKEDNLHIENVYAYNEDFKEIYIGDVPYEERGIRKNYFCLGCKRKMQAVVPVTSRKKHFRHDVLKNPGEKKCTYRDETYRHKLAKELIQIVGKIKVPAVYKFDPDKKSNQALLIKESEFIDIENVLIERHIYENKNGEIEIIHHKDTTKNLLIKPDAILLDKDMQPKLIIEFVATHKPDINKLIKLKRLGIDAIQITIPKSSPEEIQKCFSITKHTKWLYNNEESNTDFVQFSNQYSGAIFEVDDEQRKLFEEGYKCRSAEIGDLIRTIERLLQTEQYQTIERNLKSEIQRVEDNTSREQKRLDNLRERYIREGISQHKDRRRILSSSEEEFLNYREEMERRYSAKNASIGEEQEQIDREQTKVENETESIRYESGSSIREIERRIQEKRDEIEFLEREITRVETAISSEQGQFNVIERNLSGDFERVRNELRNSEDKLRRSLETISDDFEQEKGRVEQDFEPKIGRVQIDLESIRIEESSFESEVEKRERELAEYLGEEIRRFDNEIERRIHSTESSICKAFARLHDFEQSCLVFKSLIQINQGATENVGN